MRAIIRVQRDLSEQDIEKIAGAYHAWRDDAAQASSPASSSGVSPRGSSRDETSRKLAAGTAALHNYEDIAGFCKSAKLEEIRPHGHVLTHRPWAFTEHGALLPSVANDGKRGYFGSAGQPP
jgi:type I restriction enzyme M protein